MKGDSMRLYPNLFLALLVFPGGSTAAEKRIRATPFHVPGGNVPNGLSDFWQGAQIETFLHQILIALFFRLVNGSNKDLLEIHENFSGLCGIQVKIESPYIPFPDFYSTVLNI